MSTSSSRAVSIRIGTWLVGAHRAADLEPVHVGQVEVEQDQRRVAAERLVLGLGAGHGAVDDVAGLLEVGADEARDVGLVLDHEDALAHGLTQALSRTRARAARATDGAATFGRHRKAPERGPAGSGTGAAIAGRCSAGGRRRGHGRDRRRRRRRGQRRQRRRVRRRRPGHGHAVERAHGLRRVAELDRQGRSSGSCGR